VVESGADLVVCSAAATLAQPGSAPGPSRLSVQLHVCDGASLRWQPEPLVSVRGSEHHTFTTVTLEGSASLVLVEELVLGRHEETSGRVRSHTRVVRDGRPLLTHTLDVGAGAPAWSTAAVIGDARVVVTELRSGGPTPSVTARSWHDPLANARAARLPLAGDPLRGGSVLVLALGPSLSAARRAASAVR
jgi:urease accessory protein